VQAPIVAAANPLPKNLDRRQRSAILFCALSSRQNGFRIWD
jgi:hypothetical protein